MIWLNGSFEDTSKISSSDRGFLLGDGVFETSMQPARQMWLWYFLINTGNA